MIQISHARKTLMVRPYAGDDYALDYDVIAMTAGAVTRTFPVPEREMEGIGFKYVEEAVAIRDRLLASFDRAASLPAGRERKRLLTPIVVGAGFSGVEGFGEMLSLGKFLLRYYPELQLESLDFRLVQASIRIMPEVSEKIAARVVESFEQRGGRVHLNTHVVSSVDGHVALSTGEQIETNIIVWTAGNNANPVIANHTDLPVDARGYLVVRPDLRVGTEDDAIQDAWGAGDDTSVPDLSGDSPTGKVVPNAQNAVRQGRLLAKNIASALRGRPLRQYFHHSLGTIATSGWEEAHFNTNALGLSGSLHG